ncbi:MAG TPA: hypothetical protein VGG65_06475 [Thermoanaerobaculia bacterium]
MPKRHFTLAVFLTLASALSHGQTDSATPAPAGWTTNGPRGDGIVWSLVLDPANPAHLFAGTDLGVARSEDGGQTWSVFPTGPKPVFSLALDPSNPSRLFAGALYGLSLSTDGGDHFSMTARTAPTLAIAIDPTDPATLYAAGGPTFGVTNPGGGNVVQKSTDSGSTWQDFPTVALVNEIASLLILPEDHDTLLAGTDVDDSYYPYDYPPIVKSSDAGKTWTSVFVPSGRFEAHDVKAMAADPRSNHTLYAGWGGFVERSFDSGATWQAGVFQLGFDVRALAVDASAPETLYAGTDHGVFRSTDSGLHWSPLRGLPDLDVRSLALDAAGQVLHVGTASGVYETVLGQPAPSFPCRPAPDTLCLLGGRYQAQIEAWDPRTGQFTTGTTVAESDAFGYFSLPAYTGDAALPEVLVKMVDAAVPPWNANWVFFGGLTDVWYDLTITDTATGEIRTYQNGPSNAYCGGADTSGFPAALAATTAPGASARPLASSGNALALLSGRFRLTLSATDPRTGRTADGAAIVRDDRFGYFSLPAFTGDAGLPEVFVKMLDGTSVSGTFWLFVEGLSDVGYTLSVTDTTTGGTRSYTSPGAFCGGADTSIPGGP